MRPRARLCFLKPEVARLSSCSGRGSSVAMAPPSKNRSAAPTGFMRLFLYSTCVNCCAFVTPESRGMCLVVSSLSLSVRYGRVLSCPRLSLHGRTNKGGCCWAVSQTTLPFRLIREGYDIYFLAGASFFLAFSIVSFFSFSLPLQTPRSFQRAQAGRRKSIHTHTGATTL